MSDRSKNEICLNLWQFYRGTRDDGLDTTTLKDNFRHEILRGYRVEGEKAIDNAAENRFVLDATESQILSKMKFLNKKKRLNFADSKSPDQILRSMVGSMVIGMELATDRKTVRLLKTDGESEFEMIAENPMAEYKEGMVVWIAEPFIRDGKAWSDMTKEEREQAVKDNLVQGAPSMPKYLQKRRAKISSIKVEGDDTNAWLIIKLEEEAPFNRDEFEKDAILEELGISKEEDAAETKIEAATETAGAATENGVDASEIGDEHFTALDEAMEIHPPDDEATPAEEPEPEVEF